MSDNVAAPVAVTPLTNSDGMGTLPDSDLSSFKESVRALEPALAKGGNDLLSLIDRILQQNLPNEVDTRTRDSLGQSLSVILTEDASQALLQTVSQCFNDSRYLTALEQMSELETARDWLRGIVALYGQPVSRAVTLNGQSRRGWLEISRSVYRDRVADEWYIELTIAQNNGQVISIRDTPNNILLLAEALLDTLGFLPPPSSAIISEQRLAGFESAYQAFLTRVQASPTANEVNSAARGT
jgi:hypothetical protein